MNHIVLIGRLTRDPELKYSQSGKAFSKFTVAVTREFNRDEADFINCVAWGKTAETIAEYLRKGKRIGLQGRLTVNKYEKGGETRCTTEVSVDKFEFIDSAGTGVQTASYSKAAQPGSSFTENDNDEIMDDDDFPF